MQFIVPARNVGKTPFLARGLADMGAVVQARVENPGAVPARSARSRWPLHLPDSASAMQTPSPQGAVPRGAQGERRALSLNTAG